METSFITGTPAETQKAHCLGTTGSAIAIGTPLRKSPQARKQKTRELLLRAAEVVFLRDGFEKAALEEIAKLAGRTRGAIYAQFQDKEELFLDLVKSHISRRGTILRQALIASRPFEEMSTVLQDCYSNLDGNDSSGLLLLEFQLYAIRHPEIRSRFIDIYRQPAASDAESTNACCSSHDVSDRGGDRAVAIQTALAILDALQVGIRTAPVPLDQQASDTIAKAVMKAIFEPSLSAAGQTR